jgi:hypothetical protein
MPRSQLASGRRRRVRAADFVASQHVIATEEMPEVACGAEAAGRAADRARRRGAAASAFTPLWPSAGLGARGPALANLNGTPREHPSASRAHEKTRTTHSRNTRTRTHRHSIAGDSPRVRYGRKCVCSHARACICPFSRCLRAPGCVMRCVSRGCPRCVPAERAPRVACACRVCRVSRLWAFACCVGRRVRRDRRSTVGRRPNGVQCARLCPV